MLSNIDYGYIDHYNTDRGFGFIERTIHKTPLNHNVFFHIKIVKRKYPELAHQLDNHNLYQSFWYSTVISEKGEQVQEAWASIDELPKQMLDTLSADVDRYWHNIELEVPEWVYTVTKLLRGEDATRELYSERKYLLEKVIAEKKQLEAEKRRLADEERQRAAAEIQARKAAELASRFKEIKEYCAEKGITSLIHFTKMSNVNSILCEGLLGRDILECRPPNRQPQFNDELRLDGHKEAVCLSISFPNYKMFYKCKLVSKQQSEWVVLLIKAEVLWELDCAFCFENAASKNVTVIPIEQRKSVNAFRQMFGDIGTTCRAQLNIPNNYPTHPQAEVLAFDPIPPRYINSIHFYSLTLCNQWANACK